MSPLVLILNANTSDSQRLCDCLQEQAEEIDCVTSVSLSQAAEWLRGNDRPVTAVFIGGETGPAIYSFIHLLRWNESTRGATLFRLVESSAEDWGRSLCELGEALDHFLLRPFDERALQGRLTGRRAGTALLFDDAPNAPTEQKSLLRDSLSRCGYYRLYETRGGQAALDLLNEKAGEIAMVVCDWEMPSLEGARFLRRLYQSPRSPDLGLLVVTSPASVEQIRTVQLAACEVGGYLSLACPDSQLWLQVSRCLARLDKQRRAESYLREARLFLSRGKLEYADEILNHGVKTLPDMPCLFEGLGNVLGGRPESLQRAAAAYEAALRLAPMKSRWALKCLELYVALGKASEGIRIARHHLLHYGFDDTLRVRLGQLYLDRGDYRAARIELKRAFHVNPANPDVAVLLDRVDALDREKQSIV